MPFKKKVLFLTVLFSFFLSGCSGFFGNLPRPSQLFVLKKSSDGVYHRVKRGQTLWRISRTYNVELSDIVRANRISDARRVRAGQLIFIPGRKAKKKVASYQPDYRAKAKKKAQRKIKSPEEIPDLAKGDFIWPVRGRVTSYFGKRRQEFHYGVDIAARRGKEIRASRKGKVSFSRVMRGYGNVVIIDHGDGFSTVYAHNQSNLVKEGEKVKQGQVIACVGSTGRASGNHLHFEIRRGAKPVNPLFYLP